ncbi:MAG TPA: hypothetical protein VFR86_07295 [Burkholderiaceae bacterium]|nr:hypothetical protein [Burkholderiaceae bacterium]
MANARLYEGIHYRFSTEAGIAMGRQVGALAATRFLQGAALSLTRAAIDPHRFGGPPQRARLGGQHAKHL